MTRGLLPLPAALLAIYILGLALLAGAVVLILTVSR
jgi:hypothetical protein